MTTKVPLVLSLSQITSTLETLDLIPLIEEGFIALSSNKAIVPPVGELLFENPKGESHIKYGYILNQPYFVIKIASGFYENPRLGLKSSQGVMLVFSQHTGVLEAILLDEGHLTDIRTAIASMITLKHLAPKHHTKIGVIGTGIQAKLQLKYLNTVSACKEIVVWGRTTENVNAFKNYFKDSGYNITIASSIQELADSCNIIITTTPTTQPLLLASQIKKGTHITAIGADTPEKIELESAIIKKADIIVSDSIAQSKTRGEIFKARQDNCLPKDKLIELGHLIKNPELGRQNNDQITIADLTGVAVQDIMIATAIINNNKI
ncbi:hypothetical protein [uncultured Psychroserpens sp.]|uniref:hypothetical protein n=1 Tax=uncultured Psychroserpens sp. TaxID=255436 RepID=UPI00261739B0|nr:hypothetical protein [uncultured Psychroserpens sp.]